MRRRAFIAGLGSLPFIGNSSSVSRTREKREPLPAPKDQTIRVGLIGFGLRGEQLARACKLAHPDWLREQPKTVLQDFEDQQELNIEISGISDLFDFRVERAVSVTGGNARVYRDYRDMLDSDQVDAVIIATPDHWHAQMAIDAAHAGKHIYLEKCMTRTVDEAKAVREAVKKNGVAFQLGHQGRQRDLNQKARELIQKGTLGKVSLIETTTNRNDPFAAWVWPLHKDASEANIDWQRFQETAPEKFPYNPERFFRWRRYWAYGTGLSGDLLTHEYDAMNTLFDLGIPESAVASGGIYYYKDGREVPDVFHATFEYPNRELTLVYSGTLANGVPRGTLIMGHDATLELGRSLTVWAEQQSTKYRSRIEAGIINPTAPMVRLNPGQKDVDAISSATSKYFADRGLMYTFRDGKRVDPTNLHLAEWLDSIRNGGMTSCGIDRGFEEAIAAHMATIAFREGRRVRWDRVNERVT